MNNSTNPIIIGIDHGYGNIKTAHCCFKTGVAAYDKEPTFMQTKTINLGRGAFGQPSVPFLLSQRGALTHHPEGAAVSTSWLVRSTRRIRLLREPYGQCHITVVLLSLSTQTAICFA